MVTYCGLLYMSAADTGATGFTTLTGWNLPNSGCAPFPPDPKPPNNPAKLTSVSSSFSTSLISVSSSFSTSDPPLVTVVSLLLLLSTSDLLSTSVLISTVSFSSSSFLVPKRRLSILDISSWASSTLVFPSLIEVFIFSDILFFASSGVPKGTVIKVPSGPTVVTDIFPSESTLTPGLSAPPNIGILIVLYFLN